MEEVPLQRIEAAIGCAAGDPAWRWLWATIEPALWAMVDRPRFASHLAHTEDARRRIVTRVHAHLSADRGRELRRYLDARRLSPRLGFARWLHTVAKRLAMSYGTDDAAMPPVRRSAVRLRGDRPGRA